MSTRHPFWAIVAICCALAACSSDNNGGSTTPTNPGSGPANTVPVTAATEAPTTDAPTTDAPTTDAPPTEAAWETITAPSDCMCSDGSGFEYYVHRGDPHKVMFFLEGGGACFTADTCAATSDAYKKTVGHEGGIAADATAGIFDLSNPQNPFADYSIVYVPYCTGDVHIGNTTHDYGNGVVVHHNGYVNGTTALATLADQFPDTTDLVVTGESAGSVPTPLYAGLAHDLLPNAAITVLADGSGAYPDIPGINSVIGDSWGTMNAVPAWPENAGVTVQTWSLPGLFVHAGAHDPAITFARHDYAFDKTQTFFATLAGIPADDLVSLIDRNEQQIETGGVTLLSYISPGDDHTVLGKPGFYTETQNGTSLLDWVTALVAHETVADVHCTDCKVA